MASLANSLTASSKNEAGTRLRLTLSASPHHISAADVWSKGPVYQRLDSSFLEEPSIPKAPPAPRLRIDRFNGSLRVFDPVHSPDFSDAPETVSLPVLSRLDPPFELQRDPARPASPGPQDSVFTAMPGSSRPRLAYQAAAVAVGFAAGLAAAFLFGWL